MGTFFRKKGRWVYGCRDSSSRRDSLLGASAPFGAIKGRHGPQENLAPTPYCCYRENASARRSKQYETMAPRELLRLPLPQLLSQVGSVGPALGMFR